MVVVGPTDIYRLKEMPLKLEGTDKEGGCLVEDLVDYELDSD